MVGTFLRASLPFPNGRLLLLPLLLLMLGQARAADVAKPLVDPSLPAALSKAAPESVADLKAIQSHVRKVIEKVTPAVVGIRIGNASGSGVIVSADGYVLTAGHVSGKPNTPASLILPDGRIVKAKTLGSNQSIDSGMLKISDEGKWPFVEMGKSADLRKGEWVIVMGHPGGYRQGRRPPVRLGRVLEVTTSDIRTDCTLVGGDSGGPVFDMHGKVVGINSRIGPTLTSNIHVPVDTYQDTWARLTKGDQWGSGFGPRRTDDNTPFLGVEIDFESEGCRIKAIVEKSAAEKAGLRKEDVLLEIDGVKLTEPTDLRTQLAKKKIGDKITLKVRRDGETLTLELKLGRRTD